jgi:hypothetical protein
MARQAQHDYDDARSLLTRAIEVKPAKLYVRSLERLESEEDAFRMAMDQRIRREQATIEATSFTPESGIEKAPAMLQPQLGVARRPNPPGKYLR